jgi:hypothetical protein
MDNSKKPVVLRGCDFFGCVAVSFRHTPSPFVILRRQPKDLCIPVPFEKCFPSPNFSPSVILSEGRPKEGGRVEEFVPSEAEGNRECLFHHAASRRSRDIPHCYRLHRFESMSKLLSQPWTTGLYQGTTSVVPSGVYSASKMFKINNSLLPQAGAQVPLLDRSALKNSLSTTCLAPARNS